MQPLQVPREEWSNKSQPSSGGNSGTWKYWAGFIVFILLVIGGIIWFNNQDKESKKGQPINIDQQKKEKEDETVLNEGNVSPVSGLACENWNRRALAIMQPADATARPMAGFTEADMVVEMPAVYGDITRLMGVYICGNPEEVGSLRSARHDWIHIAGGLDAIYISFGASHFAEDILNKGVIDNINGLNAGGRAGGKYFFRKSGNWVKSDDNAYARFKDLLQGANDFKYRMETKFTGYAHQADAAESERPATGHLRIGYPKAWKVDYDYDPKTNSYLRTWGGDPDMDRNNNKRVAPKNVVVMIADGAQMEGQYANFQVGDPWYDDKDSGDALFYFNGKQVKGQWKKDKSKIDSKLYFKDASGNDIKFVPGQIWINVIDPGIRFEWTE